MPGWWLDLDGGFPLDKPLTLAQLRSQTQAIRGVRDHLKAAHEGSLYFPFFFWRGTELRPMQPYLNKLPAEFVELFPLLADIAPTSARRETPLPSTHGTTELGAPYRDARVSPLSPGRDPFTVDSTLVERGLKGHADTQNELARVLQEAGIEPRSRTPGEPNFDLAWEIEGVVFVAEVKSITDRNEEGQLRLGLGQVLRNRHRLRALGHANVVAVLVPERVPRDPSWRDLCHEVGAVLLSRDELEKAPTLAVGMT